MKFSFALLALPVLAAASTLPRRDVQGGSCSTGEEVCCNNEFKNYNDLDAEQKGLLAILLGAANLNAALVCSPVNVIAVGGNQCNAQVACCSKVEQNDLIGVACVPVNVGL